MRFPSATRGREALATRLRSFLTLPLVTIILSLAPAAQAHSADEIEAYRQEWEDRVEVLKGRMEMNGVGVRLIRQWHHLHLEMADFVSRHPCYFTDCEPEPRQAAPSGGSRTPSHSGGVEQWRGLVSSYFDAGEIDTALCLMGHESGGDPNAKNPRSSASGLFQLMGTWHDYFGINPFDPVQNTSAAAQLQDMYGWSQWSPWNRGLCH